MKSKLKLNAGLVLLLILPPALLELLNNVYNLYVPIFIQAGNPTFASNGTTLTHGFGMGALMVGFWMMADNLFGFFAQPIVGAWSDRTRNKRGRRIPFVLGTLPFIVLGYACIPLIPKLIPAHLNGQTQQLIGFFVLFVLSCIIYYVGYTPVRAIFQTLRQESVDTDNRIKVESWYNFAMNIFTILAYTVGAAIYRISGPLLFWIVLALYVISAVWLTIKFKEPENLVQAAQKQEASNWKQLSSVFRDSTKQVRRNLILFLISVTLFMLAGSSYTNFASSWAVNILGVDESSASMFLAIIIIATTVAVLPAGYIAAGKFGRRNMYLLGMVVLVFSAILLVIVPKLYMLGFILLGIGAGIAFPSQLPLVTELTPDQDKLGSVIGVYNIFYVVGFIVGTSLVGAIIDATSYNSLFIWMAVCMTLSLITFLFVKMPKQSELPAVVLAEIPASSPED